MIPNLALKFSYSMVHLFHRKSGGVWFLLDSIQHGEPDLDQKMKKLKRNAIQLGETNLATILVLPTNEMRFFSVEIGPNPGKFTAQKLNNYLYQLTNESHKKSSFDWYIENGRLNFALIETSILDKAIEFATKFDFVPRLVVGLSQNNSYRKVAVFDLKATSIADLPTLKQDASQFEMVAVKLPKTASRENHLV